YLNFSYDEEGFIREVAAEAFGMRKMTTEKKVVNRLFELLRDDNGSTQLAAARSFSEAPPLDKTTGKRLFSILESFPQEDYWWLRPHLIQALLKIGIKLFKDFEESLDTEHKTEHKDGGKKDKRKVELRCEELFPNEKDKLTLLYTYYPHPIIYRGAKRSLDEFFETKEDFRKEFGNRVYIPTGDVESIAKEVVRLRKRGESDLANLLIKGYRARCVREWAKSWEYEWYRWGVYHFGDFGAYGGVVSYTEVYGMPEEGDRILRMKLRRDIRKLYEMIEVEERRYEAEQKQLEERIPRIVTPKTSEITIDKMKDVSVKVAYLFYEHNGAMGALIGFLITCFFLLFAPFEIVGMNKIIGSYLSTLFAVGIMPSAIAGFIAGKIVKKIDDYDDFLKASIYTGIIFGDLMQWVLFYQIISGVVSYSTPFFILALALPTIFAAVAVFVGKLIEIMIYTIKNIIDDVRYVYSYKYPTATGALIGLLVTCLVICSLLLVAPAVMAGMTIVEIIVVGILPSAIAGFISGKIASSDDSLAAGYKGIIFGDLMQWVLLFLMIRGVISYSTPLLILALVLPTIFAAVAACAVSLVHSVEIIIDIVREIIDTIGDIIDNVRYFCCYDHPGVTGALIGLVITCLFLLFAPAVMAGMTIVEIIVVGILPSAIAGIISGLIDVPESGWIGMIVGDLMKWGLFFLMSSGVVSYSIPLLIIAFVLPTIFAGVAFFVIEIMMSIAISTTVLAYIATYLYGNPLSVSTLSIFPFVFGLGLVNMFQDGRAAKSERIRTLEEYSGAFKELVAAVSQRGPPLGSKNARDRGSGLDIRQKGIDYTGGFLSVQDAINHYAKSCAGEIVLGYVGAELRDRGSLEIGKE
ncbi:MAG: hypothetical protein DRP81_09530, partial [Candidatus Omnitrophota bacterium]